MSKSTVPCLYYSYSDNFFAPGTLVMASHIHSASDEELLRLGRRVIDKYEVVPELFLEFVRSTNRHSWVLASGTTIIFIDGTRMRIHYKMCDHSMRINWWRRQKK